MFNPLFFASFAYINRVFCVALWCIAAALVFVLLAHVGDHGVTHAHTSTSTDWPCRFFPPHVGRIPSQFVCPGER
jgi:hypothetical protein